MDMDIDDLLGPGRSSKAPARTGRFQPNAGKFKPKPKPEPSSGPDAPSQPLNTQGDSPLPPNTSEPSPSFAAEKFEEEKPSEVAEEEMAIDPNPDADNEEDGVVDEIDVFFNSSLLDAKAMVNESLPLISLS